MAKQKNQEPVVDTPDDEAATETGVAPFDDEPAGEDVTPDEESPIEEPVVGRTIPIVLRRTIKFGDHQLIPGHTIAEIRIIEECVSLNWLVDAIRGGIAGSAPD